MGVVADGFNTWLRDNVVEGNPGSGINDPSKAEGRSIGSLIEQMISDQVAATVSAGGAAKLILVVGDETTALTTGTAKYTFRLPYGFLLSEVRASLTTQSSSGDVKVDLNLAGTSILSAVIQVDATTTTSVGSAAPPAVLTAELPDNGVITVDIDAAGTGAAGLKVYMIGAWAAFGVGRIPYFVSLGANAGAYNSQSFGVPYPAGIQANDVVIMEVRTQGLAATTTPTISRPAGWTTIANPVGPSGSTSGDSHSDLKSTAAWFWKRLVGTETGSVTITASGGDGSAQGMGARMIMFRACVENGDPFESAISNSGDSTVMSGTTIVTLGPNRLAANFYAVVDNANTSDPDTGWTESYDDSFAFALGNQRRALSVAQMPIAGSTPPETRTFVNKAAWSSLSLALVPATS